MLRGHGSPDQLRNAIECGRAPEIATNSITSSRRLPPSNFATQDCASQATGPPRLRKPGLSAGVPKKSAKRPVRWRRPDRGQQEAPPRRAVASFKGETYWLLTVPTDRRD